MNYGIEGGESSGGGVRLMPWEGGASWELQRGGQVVIAFVGKALEREMGILVAVEGRGQVVLCHGMVDEGDSCDNGLKGGCFLSVAEGGIGSPLWFGMGLYWSMWY